MKAILGCFAVDRIRWVDPLAHWKAYLAMGAVLPSLITLHL